ncbi:MAG TPA: HAD-IA family hydrolase [Vicinamibacterales bacterium]|nr:HAD-IA family hydrolase [Vicinamibacterales bacterium]
MFRLYVFDLDGTLVDSRRDLADAANALLEECGGAPLAEERIGRMVGDGAAVLVSRVFAAAGVSLPPDALPRFLALYDRRLLDHTKPYAGMIETLDALRERAPMAVLTNKPLAATRRILDGAGLAPFFGDAVVGGDGPLARKPEPAGLQHLASAAGVGLASTLLVGDSVIDWETARRASARICLARYGFGFDGFPLEQIRSDDHVIDTPTDLIHL